MATTDHSNAVRRLNDLFRADVELGNRVMMSPGVKNLPKIVKSAILKKIKSYEGFESDFEEEIINHDFGIVSLGRYDIFWEIKYYDSFLTPSEAPTDSDKTIRILTVILADEL